MANSTFQVLFLILMLASAQALEPSMLGMLTERHHGMTKLNSVKSEQDIPYGGFEMRTYSQTLDHFNYGPESYATFQQQYAINFEYWGGANNSSPIFFYLGGESQLPFNLSDVFLVDNAPRFKALQVFGEHRYYGKSNPFGSKEVAYSNYSTLQYLSTSTCRLCRIDHKYQKEFICRNFSSNSCGSFLCWKPLNDLDDLNKRLTDVYIRSAQYDVPSINPVATLCYGIDGEPYGTSVLQRIISGLKTTGRILPCFDAKHVKDEDRQLDGWEWQMCTEMVMPTGSSGNHSMLKEEPFDMSKYILNCQKLFHVKPKPHWITTEYGGHDHIAWTIRDLIVWILNGWSRRETKRLKFWRVGLQSIMPNKNKARAKEIK